MIRIDNINNNNDKRVTCHYIYFARSRGLRFFMVWQWWRMKP